MGLAWKLSKNIKLQGPIAYKQDQLVKGAHITSWSLQINISTG
jgi:hypothetical protein